MKEWQDVDREMFETEIFPANRPAVLRGLLRNWPAVEAGRDSNTSIVSYLKRLDTGGTVNAFVGRPEIEGRFFYSDDYQGFNFNSQNVSIGTALDTLLSLAESPEDPPPAIALQAIKVPEVMPSFVTENSLPLLDGDVAPRIWISSRSMIAAHFDINHNIACVVSGRRKFTVFPPEEVSNLYVGPLLNTPGGPPISVVDLRNPDHEKFPRFARALEAAQKAVLEPGDAVFIPVLWWHGVESLEAVNVLVNYWWNDADPVRSDPMLSLIHAMVLMSGLPAGQREGWRELFDCLVFRKYGEPGAHLPADLRDVMGNLSADEKNQVIAKLAQRLKQ